MEARAKLFGHPIHPMLIVMPLGLLTGAIIFDVAHLIFGGKSWTTTSFWLIAVGVASGLLAAVFGLADYTKIPQDTRAKRVGKMHGVGNVIVVTLFAASWWLRRDSFTEPTIIEYALSFAGGALSVITGWLGGELVDRLGVGVDDGANLNAPSSLRGPVSATRIG